MIDWTKVKTAEAKQVEADNQSREQRIAELKQKLVESDFKFSVDYDKQDTPEWDQLKADRRSWRDEIRSLENGQ
jgi:hypothetical protein